MTEGTSAPVSVRILPNTTGNPAGKLADAEVIFGAEAGPFSGLKLIGFAIWERRSGGRNVTFPARQYSVNGERRSFALLRPANGDASAQEVIREFRRTSRCLSSPDLTFPTTQSAGLSRNVAESTDRVVKRQARPRARLAGAQVP